MTSPYGRYGQFGVENVKPLFTRGILIDLAGYEGHPNLPSALRGDPRGRARRPGARVLRKAIFRAGDALIFRYGWARFWTEPAKYNADPPGIGLEVARWVVERKASMVGSDQSGPK